MFQDHAPRKGFTKRTWIFLLVFTIIIVTLFYTSVPSLFTLTGNVISENTTILGTEIAGSLTIPEISIKGELGDIEIQGNSGFLYVESQKMPLSNFGFDKIVLRSFDGKIEFNENNISLLKGKAKQVFLNGISLMPDFQGYIDVYLEPDFELNSIKIDKNVLIKNLDYIASGEITLGDNKISLNIDNENLFIEDLVTTIKIESNAFYINGKVRILKITGDQEISILS